jgi:hypothetical protein
VWPMLKARKGGSDPGNRLLASNTHVSMWGLHRKKSFSIFPSPAAMALTKHSLGGNNDVIYKLFPTRESLVSDIPAGDGNVEKLFLQCRAAQIDALICINDY